MSEPGFEGFGIPLPAELVDVLRRTTDRAHMTAEAMAARVDSFIAGLDVDGLMALRSILNTGDMTKSLSANFWDGQIVSILRHVHHVDPATGEPDPLLAPPAESAN